MSRKEKLEQSLRKIDDVDAKRAIELAKK